MQNIFIDNKGCTKWVRAKSYLWVDGFLKPFGEFEAYNPFDSYFELYSDFYKLLSRIMEYRKALFYIEGRKMKREKYNRNIQFKDEEIKLQDEYKQFAEHWGLLGVGFSRILDVSNVYVPENGGHVTCGEPVYLYLKSEPNIMFFWTHEKYTRSILLAPDNLPEEGGTVTVEKWEESYHGLSNQNYCENLRALVASYDVLRIWNDINEGMDVDSSENVKCEPFEFFSMGMSATDGGISWRFNSLIQAISIIHALNKSAYLEANWRICPICKQMFSITNRNKIYHNIQCKNAATKRRQRARPYFKDEGESNGEYSEN